jgi:hypothetical protein
MARVNITIADQLLKHAKAAELNISRLAAAALSNELNRLSKRAALGRYLADIQMELGSIDIDEADQAKTWADRVMAPRATDGEPDREDGTTFTLDAGGVGAFVSQRGRLREWYERDVPMHVPVSVLADVLTGDDLRDHDVNNLLRFCEIVVIDEPLAREGARLRRLAKRADAASFAAALTVAYASTRRDPIVLTGDINALTVLAKQAQRPVQIRQI